MHLEDPKRTLANGVDLDVGKKKVSEARPPDRDLLQLPPLIFALEGVDEPQPQLNLGEGAKASAKGPGVDEGTRLVDLRAGPLRLR